MKRVIVIGCPGSGKSTFARALQKKLHSPIVYLDMLFWNSDQTHVSRELFIQRVQEAVHGNRWIIDGNYGRTLELRLDACDTVFFLDYPLDICLSGVENRRGTVRPDMPWVETKEDPEFTQYIRDFHAEQVPMIRQLLSEFPQKTVITFRSREESHRYLEELAFLEDTI